MVINWNLIASITSTVAGVVGTVITPIYGVALAGEISGVLQALSGLLIAIGAVHVTAVGIATSKAKLQLMTYEQQWKLTNEYQPKKEAA